MILTLATDAARSLRRRPRPRMERHHYTTSSLFEQSLDVYIPSHEAAAARKLALKTSGGAATNSAGEGEPPVVALVVGSAWLGHRLFVYGGTSWWNSSGPRAVAELGYVCVCIRHRGGFMQTFTFLTLLFLVVMAALLTALMHAALGETLWYALGEIMAGTHVTGENLHLGQATAFAMLLVAGIFLMEIGGVGAASFEQMQTDVMDALAWLHANEAKLGLQRTEESSRRLFVFGGYSSGGHVAATVTQQPQLWKERNLPPPHEHCDSMLYISPVLSTKSSHEELSRKISSLSSSTPATSPSSSSLPSLSPSEASSHLSRQSSMVDAEPTSTTAKSSPPTWLTNQVVKSVFGPSAPSVPSPIHTCDRSPAVPHLFVGCENEMFGLNLLDTFFCSPQYSEMLNGLGIESRYSAVRSDHWNILNSNELSEALRRELGWIEKECQKKVVKQIYGISNKNNLATKFRNRLRSVRNLGSARRSLSSNDHPDIRP
ncbi:hypothetical protein ACHAXT_013144 [Thalassiosira profunda]